jgi:hypothetical protein
LDLQLDSKEMKMKWLIVLTLAIASVALNGCVVAPIDGPGYYGGPRAAVVVGPGYGYYGHRYGYRRW